MDWHWIAFVYAGYLAGVSAARLEWRRIRWPLLPGVAAVCALTAAAALVESRAFPTVVLSQLLIPSIVLLLGYWLSGLLFMRVDHLAEERLQSIDAVLLERTGVLSWYRRASGVLTEFFELNYLLVYPAVPAGATVLALSGFSGELGRFWTVVLLAEFACYGALPWIQVRPPRLFDETSDQGAHARIIRRFNQWIARRLSVGASTIPSGHVAGALATALAVGTVMPGAGAVFLGLALSIAVASVLGRYHYLTDSGLGAVIAVAAWGLVE